MNSLISLCVFFQAQNAIFRASTVTIATVSANVTTPLMLQPIVDYCIICHPSPPALSVIQICQPLPSCHHWRFCHRAAILFHRPSAAAVLSLLSGELIIFAAPIDGWLFVLCLPSRVPTALPSGKPSQFPHSWTCPFGGKPPKVWQSLLWTMDQPTAREIKTQCWEPR